VLKEYLKKLKREAFSKRYYNGRFNNLIDEIRYLILKVTPDCPYEDILKIIENDHEDWGIRNYIFELLNDERNKDIEKRILSVYIRAKSFFLRFYCLYYLKDSEIAGLTQAMIQDALHFDDDATKIWGRPFLVDVLNQRLGTSFSSLENLRAYLKISGIRGKKK